MTTHNLLLTFTSTTQWGLFLGVALIIFGWVEKKPSFADYGRYAFILLGIYALWIIYSGQITVPPPVDGQLSKEAQILAFFKGIVVLGGLSVIATALKLFKIKYHQFVTIGLILWALFQFFIVYRLQQQ